MAQWQQTGLNIRGPEGPKGDPGEPGEDGAGVQIAGQVATYGELPTGLGADDAGAGYLVEADGRLYVWSGTGFPTDGAGVEFRGPTGPPGQQGDQGERGDPGPQGDPGDRGPAGTIAVGNVATGAPGSSATVNNAGTATEARFDFSIPQGAKGDTGGQGSPGADGVRGSLWFTGTSLPSSGMQAGDLFLDTADGTVFRYQ